MPNPRPATEQAFLSQNRRFTVTFTVADVPTAPTGNVTYREIKPDGTDNGGVTSGWQNPSTGVYYRDVALDTVGLWRLKGSATVSSTTAADYGYIDVTDPMTA